MSQWWISHSVSSQMVMIVEALWAKKANSFLEYCLFQQGQISSPSMMEEIQYNEPKMVGCLLGEYCFLGHLMLISAIGRLGTNLCG